MNITDSALNAGFTHVATMGGPIPLQMFHLRDALGMTYADGVIYGPWRPATTFEEIQWEQHHAPMIGLQARDKWCCLETSQSPTHAF